MKLRLPSPALVIACLALAVALSGVGYAAKALPRNSVGTKQLKNNAVNSAKVQNGTLAPADFRGGVINAGLLDGLDSTAFLGSGAKAADADRLDGLDSAAFARGLISWNAIPLNPGTTQTVLSVPNKYTLSYTCPNPTSNNGTLRLHVLDSGMNVFVDSGTANPIYTQSDFLTPLDLPALASGDSWVLQTYGSETGLVVMWIATVNRATDCHAQAMTLRG